MKSNCHSCFLGMIPSFNGTIPDFPGAIPDFLGAIPGFQGAIPGFQGAIPGFQGAIPSFQGAIPGHFFTSCRNLRPLKERIVQYLMIGVFKNTPGKKVKKNLCVTESVCIQRPH